LYRRIALTEVAYLLEYLLSYKSKAKLSRYMPWRHMGGEEV
jgi:hypothetical protein